MKELFYIIYEDKFLAVINKYAGVVVHGGIGVDQLTLCDAIKVQFPGILKNQSIDCDRIGIVHRLDKDTSGIMIIAKDPKTAENLKKQFKNRKIKKTYLAFAHGLIRPSEDLIYLPVGRKLGNRTKMTTTAGKPAITKYKVIDYFRLNKNEFSYLKVMPKTGRMHQIRVHLKHKGNPIVGDQKYLKGKYKKVTNQLGINRQLLHAYKIIFKHPVSQKIMKFKAPIPQDFKEFKKILVKCSM